jgi:hypothetical protein
MENKEYIKELNYGKVTVVQNKDYQWAVIDDQGNIVVPLGKYAYIDGFENGLARVHTVGDSGRKTDVNAIKFLNYKNRNKDRELSFNEFIRQDRKENPNKYAKWGIINENGEEVLPVIYDDVWKFYGKDLSFTNVEKDGARSKVYFHDLDPSIPLGKRRPSLSCRNYDYDDTRHYDEFAGSYAQDVMGYSDEDIYDAFDGDADAYWNID